MFTNFFFSLQICVPRTGVFVRHSLTQKDFENHILQADEEHAGVFTTLNGKVFLFFFFDLYPSTGHKHVQNDQPYQANLTFTLIPPNLT